MKKKKKKNNINSFDYDVAISYASKNIRIVNKYVRGFKKRGIRVFFDKDFQAHLWGKNNDEFRHIYGPGSMFVIPFISKEYNESDFCQNEFEIAKLEAKRRDDDFLLPIRLDDTPQLGLKPDTIYFDIKEKSESVIINSLLEKIKRIDKVNKKLQTSPTDSKSLSKILILDTKRRYNLGILALSFLPISKKYLKSFFKDINWEKEFKYFKDNGLLKKSGNTWIVPDKIIGVFDRDNDDHKKIIFDWITALSPLANHTDITLALSFYLLKSDSIDGAVMILSDMAMNLDSGIWNNIYLNVLEYLNSNLKVKQVSVENRSLMRNALGICMTNAGRNEDAVTLFRKLYIAGKRTDNEWIIAQSLINCGVAQYQLGDISAAKKTYRKSIKYAESIGDELVLARSLNNLAQILIDSDPKHAIKLIDRSIILKKSKGDKHGLVNSLITLGNLSVHLFDYKKASDYYNQAYKKAKQYDLRLDQSLALINSGNIKRSLGNYKQANSLYSKAFKIASREEFIYPMTLSLQNKASLRIEQKHFNRAKNQFEKLVQIYKKEDNYTGLLSTLHNIGAVLINSKKFEDGRAQLKKVMTLAKKKELYEILFKSQITFCLSYLNEGKVNKCCKSFEKFANIIKHIDTIAAVNFLIHAAEVEVEYSKKNSKIIYYYKKAQELLLNNKSLHGLLMYGTCAEGLGKLQTANRILIQCKKLAIKNNELKLAFNVTLKLALNSFNLKDYNSTEYYLKETSKYLTTPIENIKFLILKLDLLILQNNVKEIERTFHKAIKLCRKHDFTTECVDFHMKLGDYYWSKSKRMQYSALKAFIVGLSESCSLNEEVISQVGSHIVKNLFLMNISNNNRISYLEKLINEWLKKDKLNKSIIDWLLWPFRVTSRLSNIQTPELITEKQIIDAFNSEIDTWHKYDFE